MTATTYESTNSIATITLNAPDKLNAFTAEMCASLTRNLEQAEADEHIRCIVITGAGRAFSAGIDLGMIDTDPQINLGPILENHFEPIFNRLLSMSKPVVAKVNGPCAGVSAGLALAADITIASDKSFLLIPFVELGLLPDGALTWLLPRLAGNQAAAALCLLGEKMSAAECQQRGLIWKAVTADALDAETMKIAERMASQPAQAVSATKKALGSSWRNELRPQMLIERELQQACGRSDVFREKLGAFLT